MMVHNVAATIDVIVANGGEIVQPIRRRRTRAHCKVPRSGGKRDRRLPATRLTELRIDKRAGDTELLDLLQADRSAIATGGLVALFRVTLSLDHAHGLLTASESAPVMVVSVVIVAVVLVIVRTAIAWA